MATFLAKLTFIEYGTLFGIMLVIFMVGIMIGSLDND